MRMWAVLTCAGVIAGCGIDAPPEPEAGTFVVLVPPDPLVLAQGGSATLPVQVARNGDFQDAVSIHIESAPEGVSVAPITVQSAGELTFTTAAVAMPEATTVTLVAVAGSIEKRLAVPIEIQEHANWDPTFGVDGLATLPLAVSRDIPIVIVERADHRMVVLVFTMDGTRLVGLDSNGALDATFGRDGVAAPPIEAFGLISLPDHKLVVLGSTQLARCQADGSPDPTFGTDGVMELPFGLRSVALQADGKLVVAAVAQDSSKVVVFRVLPDGGVDASFGSAGQVTFALEQFASTNVGNIVLQSDGSIVVPFGGLKIARIGASGERSKIFELPGNIGIQRVVSIALQGDAITVAGVRSINSVVLRYLPDGTFDTTFGTNGFAPLNGEIREMHIAPDGGIVALTRSTIVRFASDGGFGGVTTRTFEGSTSLLDAGGRLLRGGRPDPFPAQDEAALAVVERVRANGATDDTFGAKGQVKLALHAANDALVAVSPAGDGTLLAHGFGGVIGRLDPRGTITPVETVLAFGPLGDPALFARGSTGYFVVSAIAQRVERFLPDGRFDFAFQTIDAGPFCRLTAITVLPGDDILVAGSDATCAAIVVARYTASGTPRPFDSGSNQVVIPVGPDARVNAMIVASDHYLLAGAGNGDAVIVKIRATSGVLDPTFADAGVARAGFESSASLTAITVHDGTIMGAGISDEFVAAVRYTPEGELTLRHTFPIPNHTSPHLAGIAVYDDGRFAVVGDAVTTDSTRRVFAMRRKASGQLDLTFGTNGLLSWATTTSIANAVTIVEDQLVIAGASRDPITLFDAAVWRTTR